MFKRIEILVVRDALSTKPWLRQLNTMTMMGCAAGQKEIGGGAALAAKYFI